MQQVAPLGAWTTLYTIAGSSAAALVGLMFVVVTLVGDAQRRIKDQGLGVSVFSTPTVIHLTVVLSVSLGFVAPWGSLTGPAVLLGLAGIVGALYVAIGLVNMRRLEEYESDAEDWAWFNIIPLLTYVAMIIAAILLLSRPEFALFLTAGCILALLVIGIRNSWDVVTYLTVTAASEDEP